jgi:hypothetical protein
VLALLVLVVVAAAGATLTRAWDPEASPLERACAGVPIGVASLALVGFGLAWLFGLETWTVLVATGVVAGCCLAASSQARPAVAPPPGRIRGDAVFLLLAAPVLVLLFRQAMQETPAGIAIGVEHNLGDLPFHLAVITGFLHDGNFPPDHPELAGVRLTYPFLIDFGAAQLAAVGASLSRALLLQNVALALALVGLLRRLARSLVEDERAGWLAPLLFLANGGLGFLLLSDEVARRGLLDTLLHLGQDVTITRDGRYRWGSVVTTLLIPQRALLLGLPLALCAWQAIWDSRGHDRRRLLGAGLVTALLPLSHAHAFVCVMATALGLALLEGATRLPFFGPALALGGAQAAWLAAGSSLDGPRFLAFQPGWDHGTRNPLLFWLENTGLFLPLYVLGLSLLPPRARRFSAPFVLLFVVPNLLRLSPWIWDNVKFLVHWYVLAVVAVAALLARLSRRGWPAALLAAALLGLLTLSGGLDLWRTASGQVRLVVFDADAVAFADEVRRHTTPRAVVLHLPTYDSPVYLTGRRSVIGYPGHLWSQGLPGNERGVEVQLMYQGGAPSDQLLSRYGVRDVVVGPGERAQLRIAPEFLATLDLVVERGPYQLYRRR